MEFSQIIVKLFQSSTANAVVLKQDLLNALKLLTSRINSIGKPENYAKRKSFELSSANNDIGENKTYLDAAATGENVALVLTINIF